MMISVSRRASNPFPTRVPGSIRIAYGNEREHTNAERHQALKCRAFTLLAFVAKVRKVFAVVQRVVWVADIRMRARPYRSRMFGRKRPP